MAEDAEDSEAPTRKCSKCGFQNPESLKFCGNCGAKLPVEEVQEESPVTKTVKCGNCGFQNPRNLKYCGNCGAKIKAAWLGSEYLATRYEALALLLFAGSSYLLISLLFNALVQSSYLFLVPYIVSAVLGYYAGYSLYQGKHSRSVVYSAVAAVLLGLVASFLLFVIGLQVRGVVGPVWIIFLINLWYLYKIRDRLRRD